MKLILQEETTGCGFAAVAMISGTSYSKVRELANSLGIYAADDNLFTSTNYVRQLSAQLNIELSEVEIEFTEWKQLPKVALLATKHRIENGQPRWHWSVYDGVKNQVLDPASYLEINKRTDFENINIQWYIEVKIQRKQQI